MIPFLVVDRPASLRIIKGAKSSGTLGLMSHANTTPLFRKLYKSYPCGEEACHAIDPSGETTCKVHFDVSRCDIAQSIQQNTIKICDCGMFTKYGVQYKYPELFQVYDEMGADYGIMLDVFGDKDATIASARSAIRIYQQHEYNFRLVLVAQGRDLNEYMACYEALKEIGGEYIAIGGLLQRRAKTVRYVHVRSEEMMFDVLKKVRERFDPAWLFALGCYHPKRHRAFDQLGVWGSDYKGWIFQYKKRERRIQLKWEEIVSKLHSRGLDEDELVFELISLTKERSESVKEQERHERKKSPRYAALKNRLPVFVEFDNSLQRKLKEIIKHAYLDGTKRSISRLGKEIFDLTQKTEQQIRYEQVRKTIEKITT